MTLTEEDYQKFFEYLHKGALLLDFEDFDSFHFDINLENAQIRDLATLLIEEGVNDKNYFKKVEPMASEILKTLFIPQKEKDICGILQSIESKNSDDKELCATTSASRMFLEDEHAEHHRLPLAITRLIEDTFVSISDVEEKFFSEKKTDPS